MPQRVVAVEANDADCHRIDYPVRLAATDCIRGLSSLYQESKLARSGLGDLFIGVEILSEKNVSAYRSVLARRGIKVDEFVMVGNSLRSDIVPVLELGARAVHIPYHITWQHEHVPEESLPKTGWYRLEKISELSRLLAEL